MTYFKSCTLLGVVLMPGAQGCRVCVWSQCVPVFASQFAAGTGSRGLPHACAGLLPGRVTGVAGAGAQTDTTRGAFLFTSGRGREGGRLDGVGCVVTALEFTPSCEPCCSIFDIAAMPSGRKRAREEVDEEKTCRLCWGDEEDGPLVQPCACRGTAKWVHKHCLEEWRRTGERFDAAYRCGQCMDHYRDALRASSF